MTIAGAVLCGGASRRMGTDKATLPVAGRAMALRVADALARGGCAPVVAVGRPAPEGLTVVDDERPGDGPLAAVATALRWATVGGARGVLVAACDLPWLTTEAVTDLVGSARRVVGEGAGSADAMVVVARSDRLEPLFAVWQVDALAAVERSLADGERAVHRALARLATVEVAVPTDVLRNVNAPSDLPR